MSVTGIEASYVVSRRQSRYESYRMSDLKTFLVTDLNNISILFNENSFVNMFSSIYIHYKLNSKVSFQFFLCKFTFLIPRIRTFFVDLFFYSSQIIDQKSTDGYMSVEPPEKS